jgi:hypothetical protein
LKKYLLPQLPEGVKLIKAANFFFSEKRYLNFGHITTKLEELMVWSIPGWRRCLITVDVMLIKGYSDQYN